MSKVGQKPITIPSSVKIDIKDHTVTVTGAKGALTHTVPKVLSINLDGDQMTVSRSTDSKDQKTVHGLYRNIIANAVKGVSDGWTKRLEVVGTGYNVKMQGQSIILKVGYSHTVVYKPADGIQLATEGNNIIIVSGFDKQLVGQVAHQIKIIKPPDIYKGKGIRYEGEHVRIKPGKKAKTA